MDLFVARQPIFDLRGNVVAYELLYRGSGQSHMADGGSTNQMSLEVIIQSFLEIGLDRITRGKLGFINFSREMLLSGCYELLDRGSIVVELLEDVEADAEVIAACERLVGAGYRLALDDYTGDGTQKALLELAEIIKLDVLNRPYEEVAAVAEPLRARGLTLLAERVETAEVRDACRDMGFSLFQGYFFSRPEIVANKGVGADQTAILQLMSLLQDDVVSDAEVESAFRRNPALSYKLLRIVNAASQGAGGVESILHAIRLLGRGTLHRWLSLLLASSLATQSGEDGELVHGAVLRARLCELLGQVAGKGAASGALFMLGLFSLMDALLRIPMQEILSRVDLPEAIQQALLHREGPYAEWLALAEAYEAGEWDAVTRHSAAVGVSPLDIPEVYLQSLSWAREQVVTASAAG